MTIDYKVILLLLFTMLLWGATPIVEKTALKNTDPIIGILIRSLFISIILVVVITLRSQWSEVIYDTSLRVKLLFCLSGLMAGLLGMFTYFIALKNAPTSVVVPIAASYPLVSALLGILILGEAFTYYRLLGVLLIVVGVWLVK